MRVHSFYSLCIKFLFLQTPIVTSTISDEMVQSIEERLQPPLDKDKETLSQDLFSELSRLVINDECWIYLDVVLKCVL